MAQSNVVNDANVNNPLKGLQDRFKVLPQKNKVAILFGVPLMIGVLISLMMWANTASYRVLFSGLSDKDGGEIVTALEQLKIPYQFNTGGTAILVPSDQVYDARLALASQGLPKGSISGFESMDNQKLGITQFQEQVNYQRALEGELVRSIQSLSAVQSARVHLAIPKPSIFIRDKQKPTASVVLNLYGGRTLSESQIAGVVHLVASSLPGMMPEGVSIVDQTGRLLTRTEVQEAGLNPTQLAYTSQIENNLTMRINEILSPMFGRENVRATVTANMNFAQSERTDEFYKPNGDNTQATIRSQQIRESREGESGTVQGIPGVMANTPPGNVNAPINDNAQANMQGNAQGANNADSMTSMNRDSTINYEVDKTIQYTREQVGKLEKLSAAVVVNYKTILDNRGESRQVPLTPEEITQVDQLVKQAIGFDAARGDQINVVNQLFAEQEAYEPSMWEQPETMDMIKSLGLPLGVALLAAILVFGLFKPMLSPVQRGNNEGPELLPGQKQPLLPGPNASSEDLELLEQLHREVNLPNMTAPQKLERLRRLAREHPQVVAGIVRQWVSGETQNA